MSEQWPPDEDESGSAPSGSADPQARPEGVRDPVDGLPDPRGLDLAISIAHGMADILPPPRTSAPAEKRRSRPGRGRRDRARSDPELVGALLDQVASSQGWTTEIGLRRLLARWPELVGTTTAEHSRPEAYSRSVLQVRTDSTAWATQLRHLAPAILVQLNDKLGQGSVTAIVVKGPDAPSWKHGKRSISDARGPRDTYG